MDLGLAGRRFVITGASRGIGLAIARSLAAEGARLALCARDADALDAELGSVRAVDVRDASALEAFVADAASELGGLDGAVANVGGASGGDIGDASADDWAETMAINAGHSATLVRAALPHLTDTSSIVLIASVSGMRPGSRAQYAAAKAAVIQMASSLAPDLAPRGVRVNAVSPGSIMFEGGGWDRFSTSSPEAFADWIERDLPAGRLGTPEEVAHVVSFLLSPRASWINGANIVVDGAQGRPNPPR